MGKDWNRFFWPMAGLVVALIVTTVVSYHRYGDTFWNTFYPQFLATVFGVVLSIMFAWALWRLQQRAQESRMRKQLIKNLKFEVDENIKRLEDTDRFLDVTERQGGDSTTMRGLRTVASKHILKPENLAILGAIQLEDDVDWMLMHVERYNAVFTDISRQFFSELQSDKDMKEATSQLRSRILSESSFLFLQGFLKDLSQRIDRLG